MASNRSADRLGGGVGVAGSSIGNDDGCAKVTNEVYWNPTATSTGGDVAPPQVFRSVSNCHLVARLDGRRNSSGRCKCPLFQLQAKL